MVKTRFQIFLEKKPEYKEKLKPPKLGEIVEGEIVEKEEKGIYLEIPGFGFCFLPKEEIEKRDLKLGEKIKVKIQKFFPKEEMFLVSLTEAEEDLAWEEIEKMEKNKTFITLKAIDANKGGLIFEFSGIQGFLPASCLSKEHYPKFENPDSDSVFEALKKLVGKEFKLKILQVDRKQKKLIFSEK